MTCVRAFGRSAVVVLTLVLLAACTSSSVSNGAPPTAPPGPAVQLVVLGADDAFGPLVDRTERNRASWPQLLYRDHLPARATLVNLASPGATASDVRDRQVPRALSVQPTITVVWVAGDETALTSALQALAGSGAKVLALARPGDAQAAERAATAAGAQTVVVDDGASQQAIADAVSAALGPVS